MTLPNFVDIGQRSEWFPEHDSLYSSDLKLLEDNNAFLFWQFNRKVRKALMIIRQRIDAGEQLKVTRTLVAEIAKVQYGGIYNQRRRGWIMREIEHLNRLKEKLYNKKVTEEKKYEFELKDLMAIIRELQQDKVNLQIDKSVLIQDLDNHKRLVKTLQQKIIKLQAFIEDKLSN
jgi:hypothetical protein